MGVHTHTLTVSCAGGNGAATGTADTSVRPCRLLGMEVKYTNAPTGSPTVTVTNMSRQVAKHTGATKFFAYRENVVDTGGTAAAAGDNRWDSPILNGNVHFAVAAADPDTNGQTPFVTVTLYYTEV